MLRQFEQPGHGGRRFREVAISRFPEAVTAQGAFRLFGI
jgi:hypothetical protein